MLNNYEWELLSKLVNILEPFDQLTTYLSGMQYTTLSVVNPSIEALKYQYAGEMTLSVDELNQMWNNQEELRSDNESNSSHSENEESSESESDGEHFASSHKHNTRSKKHESSPIHSINTIVANLRSVIYNSLWHYWSDMDKVGLMATLLDPRLKGMDTWPEEIREQTIIELRREFQKFITVDVESISSNSIQQTSSTPSFMKNIFSFNQPQSNHETEIDDYLNPQITPAEPENTDAYLWWCLNQNNFQILSKIARKYLSIPATSVPSERLFSVAGNQITSQRTRLAPDFVNQLLFVKRNSLYCDMWSYPN